MLSKEFIYTAIINVIAAIIYLVLIGLKFQTNDDTAFAMLAEVPCRVKIAEKKDVSDKG